MATFGYEDIASKKPKFKKEEINSKIKDKNENVYSNFELDFQTLLDDLYVLVAVHLIMIVTLLPIFYQVPIAILFTFLMFTLIFSLFYLRRSHYIVEDGYLMKKNSRIIDYIANKRRDYNVISLDYVVENRRTRFGNLMLISEEPLSETHSIEDPYLDTQKNKEIRIKNKNLDDKINSILIANKL